MLPTLRELGLLSARLVEEEALLAKQRLNAANAAAATTATTTALVVPATTTNESSGSKTCTIVSAPVPTTVVVQKSAGNSSASSSSSRSSVSSSSLPDSPISSPSPPNPTNECAIPATVVPFLTQHASFPGTDKLQQIGLSFMPVTAAFQSSLPAPQGILVQTPMGITQLPALSAAMLTTQPQYVQAPPPQMNGFTSLTSARMRKPFHKRRPAHMDKNMLFCHFCGRKETPEWRKGPGGPATLCNACGLQWAKKIRAQRSAASAMSSAVVANTPSASAGSSSSSSSESSSDMASKATISDADNKSAKTAPATCKKVIETAEAV